MTMMKKISFQMKDNNFYDKILNLSLKSCFKKIKFHKFQTFFIKIFYDKQVTIMTLEITMTKSLN